MSGTTFNSTSNGDWGTATIWSTGSVPNAPTADVNVANNVTIGSSETFAAGTATVDSAASLSVVGALGVAGGLTLALGANLDLGDVGFGNPPPVLSVGTVTAGSYLIGGIVTGDGTLAGSGTLLSNGHIFTNFGDTLTLATGVYRQSASGLMNAFGNDSVLQVAPTGSFANMSAGTLTGGTYTATGGTLELPDRIDAIVAATIILPVFLGTIEAGGTSLAATLGTIGNGAELNINGADFVTANTLTVNGGTITPFIGGTLDAAGITLATATSTLAGPGTVIGDITDNGLVTTQSGSLSISGAVSGDGSIDVIGAATITAGSVTLDGGAITVSEGTLSVATALVMNGGTITLGRVLSAGTLVLGTGATTLQGSGTVTGSIDNAGLIDANGSVPLDLDGPVTGAGSMEIAISNRLELAQASSQSVSFDAVGFGEFGAEQGTLRLDQPASFTGTITGFMIALQHGTVAADSIDLAGFAPGTLTESYNGTTADGTLTVMSGTTVVASLDFQGDYTHAMFTLEPDSSGGSIVKILPPPVFSDAANGDWGSAASWTPAAVPDNTADYVLIDQHTIIVASGDSFTVGNLVMSGTGDSQHPLGIWGTLAVAGTLDVAQQLTVDSTADLQIDVNALVIAGSISNSSGVPIHGAGTLQAGGTLGGQVLANMAGQTLTVMPTAFNGAPEANGAGATLLLAPTEGASGFINAAGGNFTHGVMKALQGGTLELPGAISEISGSTLSTPQVTLDGAGSSILGDGTPIQNSLTLLAFGAQLELHDYDYQGTAPLTVGGFVWDGGGSGTLAPASYQELASGQIDASDTMVLATGSFANLANGTLSIGTYASSGTLELPGTVDALVNATVSLASGEILTGGSPIQNSLSIVGSGAELAISSGTYSTTNTLTVNGGTILLSGFESIATFGPAAVTLDPGASVLQGSGTISAAVDNAALILANGSGQLLDLTGSIAGAGSLEIARSGTLGLAQANSENLSFDADGAGVLVLAQPGSYRGTLLGFATGVQGGNTFADKIDLPAFAPGTLTDTYDGNTAGGTLTIKSGTTIVSSLHFAGDYSQNSFTLESDSSAGTFIEATPPLITESINHGDWSEGTIWNTGTVPNAPADYVLLQTQVTIDAGESFTIGTLDISEANLFAGVGETSLSAIGTLDVVQLITIEFDAALTVGAPGQAGIIASGSIDNAGTIHGAGTLAIGTGLANTGLINAIGGLLDITGPITGNGSLEIGPATLELGGASGEAATFDPLGGGATLDVLKLDLPGSYTGTISGFAVAVSGGVTLADAVDLVGVAPATLQPGYSGDASGGTLTLQHDSTTVASLVFAGNYVNAQFTLEPDGAGGTNVELVPCYCTGTRIATPHGEVAVEDLREGDLVLTIAGKRKPILWIGHRGVDCALHPRPELVWPVRIRAGAFGDNEPVRDLWLSPDHAVLRSPGALIPVKYLVNGATVVQEPRDHVTYWHVELDRHDVILAEGLPCESYLDTGNRGAFANGGVAHDAGIVV